MRETVGHNDGSDAEGVRFDAGDPAFRERPHDVFDALRETDPVHRDHALDRVVLTRAVDVGAVLADRIMSSDPFKGRPTAYGRRGFTDADRGKLSMLFLDDPDHARLRAHVAKAFTARATASLRPCVEAIAGDLLARLDPHAPFDLVVAYAAPLPILVIAALLGLDDADTAQFKQWSEASTVLLAAERSEAEQSHLTSAREGLSKSILRTAAHRRAEPRDDLISALVAAEAEGHRLTEAEILNACRLLLIVGNVITTDLIGNGTVALLRHPEQLARLRAEPGLWPAAVEEILRYDGPVASANRQVVEGRSVGGCPVEAGQPPTAMLLAANHDPDLHADPHAFDITHAHQKHLSLSGGAHFCLGASLARLEAQVGLSMLFDRFPLLRRAPLCELQRKAQPAFNGFEAVWLNAR